jgi:hypothetical protein
VTPKARVLTPRRGKTEQKERGRNEAVLRLHDAGYGHYGSGNGENE